MLTSMTGSFHFGRRPAITGAGTSGGNGGSNSSGNGLYDDLFNTNILFIHANGINGARNNTFLDGSTNAYTVTRNGTPTQGTFSPFSQTGWSNYFAGSTDYLSLPSNAAFNLASASTATVEFWVYLPVLPGALRTFVCSYNSGGGGPFWIGIDSSNHVQIYTGNGAGGNSGTTAFVANRWYHIALVKEGASSAKVYMNGTLEINAGSFPWAGATQVSYIGTYSGGTPINAYISNVRILNGTALYVSDFTPPTVPLTAITNTVLLTCQSNRFIDNSTNAFTITPTGTPKVQAFSPFVPVSTAAYSTSTVGGSVYCLAGTSDYLTVGTSGSPLSALGLGTGAFTIEFWIYPVSAPNTWNALFDINQYTGGILMRYQAGSDSLYILGTAYNWAPTTNLILNQWSHVVLARNGSGAFRLYVNGTSIVSGTNAGNLGSTGYMAINAAQHASGQNTTAYYSNFRIVKGTAVYDPTVSTLTVPTTLGTAITNTSFLLDGTNAAIYDQTAKNDILTVGSAQLSTSQYKFGTASMYFNGTSDYITMPTTPVLQLGTGDFTIETWSYLTSRASSYPCIFGNYNSFTTGALSIFAGHGSSSSTAYQVAYNGSFPAIAGGTITYNTWNHIALVRSSGTLTLYINGTVTGTPVTGATAALNGVGTVTYIGTAGDAISGGYIAGYLDEFRISKYARYTSAFTPSAVEFGDTGSSGSGGGSGGSNLTATGGTMSIVNGNTWHTFTSSGTFTTYGSGTFSIDYLVVAGGGGGGGWSGGGGGGGGFLSADSYSISAGSTITVTIGAGGTGAPASTYTSGNWSSGSNSTLVNSGIAVATAVGGGAGAVYNATPSGSVNGGSGGGASYLTSPGTGTAGPPRQGYDGSSSGGSGGSYYGGGGGGAGAAGSGSNGGAGLDWPTGSGTYYAGGGAASVGYAGGSVGTGGSGVGGNGYGSGPPAGSGTVNTGGGGAGAGTTGGAGTAQTGGGSGGSGVVIIKYTGTASFSVPLGGTKTIVGSYTYHTFTSSGTMILPYATTIDYLVVAGGGGGGGWAGGGGGAGGLLSAASYSVSDTTSLVITIGAGGTGAPTGTYTAGNWSSGSNTTVVNGGTTIASATGGGAGATYGINPTGSVNGGSGGGGSYITASGTGTAGPPRQGYDGAGTGGTYYGTAGGGAGAAGSGSNGGAGVEWPASSGTYYAGGGAASSSYNGGSAGTGGSGVGGNGVSSSTVAGSGTANRGGGGAGAYTATSAGTSQQGGGNGGSGVVIIRYLT